MSGTLQEKIDDIHAKLGEYSGIQQVQSKTLDRINESLAILAENTVKTDMLMQFSKQHDKRIFALEQKMVLHEELLKCVKDNTYFDTHLNRYARYGIALILGGLFMWACKHLPKLIVLLETN